MSQSAAAAPLPHDVAEHFGEQTPPHPASCALVRLVEPEPDVRLAIVRALAQIDREERRDARTVALVLRPLMAGTQDVRRRSTVANGVRQSLCRSEATSASTERAGATWYELELYSDL